MKKIFTLLTLIIFSLPLVSYGQEEVSRRAASATREASSARASSSTVRQPSSRALTPTDVAPGRMVINGPGDRPNSAEINIPVTPRPNPQPKPNPQPNTQPVVQPRQQPQYLYRTITSTRQMPYDLDSPLLDNYLNWGYERVNAKAAHDAGLSGKGVNILVIDSGIRPHMEFNGKNINMINIGKGTVDDSGHGTGVIGIIISSKNVLGVAPQATIYSAKVNEASGVIYSGKVTEAINWAIESRARATARIDIINLSYGSSQHDPTLARAIEKAYDAGIIIVAPAGNDGTNGVKFPANLPQVFAVFGTNPLDGAYESSSYGSQVDFAAPGQSIYSTNFNNQYVWISGTSYSAPYISGLAAITIESYRKSHNGHSPTPAQVKEILTKAASPTKATQSSKQGAGIVDAAFLVKL